MPNKPLKIVIAGGGSGGHLFPGLAIAEEFLGQRPDTSIWFFGSKHGVEQRIIPQYGYPLVSLSVSGLYKKSFGHTVLGLCRLGWSFLQAMVWLLKIRPDLVVGVGGYASFPALFCAWVLRIPRAIQEQNASPGITNRYLSFLVPIIFCPFEGMQKYLRGKLVVVQNPLRKNIEQLSHAPKTPSTQPLCLGIIGGSQGAAVLNQIMQKSMPLLQNIKQHLRIIHQAGPKDIKLLQAAYAEHQIRAEVFDFIKDMPKLYQQTDLVLSRSGSIIFEFLAAGKPSLLVPIAWSSGNHQHQNAKRLEQADAAVLLVEKQLSPQKLVGVITALIEQPKRLKTMAKNARALHQPRAALKIVETCIQFFKL